MISKWNNFLNKCLIVINFLKAIEIFELFFGLKHSAIQLFLKTFYCL